MDTLDREVRVALAATRDLHAQLGTVSTWAGDETECVRLRRLAAKANQAIVAAHRLAHQQARLAGVREAILKEEVAAEGIDRQANAARLQERMRFVMDRMDRNAVGDALTPIQRAQQAVEVADRAVASLCPHAHTVAAGAGMIAGR